ncbi:transposase family protein [Streptomyces sp. HUAS TT7]|uniref:transposase family protein n=1 Tax=Streptomyces sp. HUAS TT7 TaxID=3447507 RepID=UPI003F656074
MSPHLDVVRVERVWVAGGVVRVAACTRELTVGCPDCGRGSARVHSRYVRTLADLAVGERPVLIGLTVRRLFCDGPGCARRTFAEQVEGLTVRYGRRTPLLQHLVVMAGVLLAGRGGARLLQILQVPLSRTSVLFHLMRIPLPAAATPRVLGVDDFALYADVYGTLLVDADTRLPIELWAGRDAEQLAAWLRTHPGVEVVCRDGSLVYRQGITDGAPDAVQVSDRFQCAMRRLVVSPIQSGGIWREILGSDGLPNPETVMGTRACQEIDDRAQVSETGYRGTRVTR